MPHSSKPLAGAGPPVPVRPKPFQLPDPVSLPSAPTNIYAGTSGWAYPTWKPGFFPAGLPARKFLSFYATRLNSVEVNYTFRTLPTQSMLEDWLAATPPGFRFSFKAPQRITHFQRLHESEDQLDAFLAALAPAAKAGKLGMVLFQLPPNFKLSLDRLHTFLAHPPLRDKNVAFEFRHDTWFCDEVYSTLRQHEVQLCIADGDLLTTPEVHTAQASACFRLRRDGGYEPTELQQFAARMTALAASGRECYTYFRHQDQPTGALNATAFLAAANSLTSAAV